MKDDYGILELMAGNANGQYKQKDSEALPGFDLDFYEQSDLYEYLNHGLWEAYRTKYSHPVKLDN